MSNSTPPLSPSELSSQLRVIDLIRAERAKYNILRHYRPYPKQSEFHAAGRSFRERLLMAGNQLGKTLCAAAETAIHATGRYPDGWEGRVFDKPINAWVAGVTGESTRDNPQRWLYGKIGDPGSGMVPRDAIKDVTASRGLADALDTMLVLHGGGGDVQQGTSQIGFKAYVQGREKWQGPTKDFIWFDEEPPPDIYSEGLTRTNLGLSPVCMTFTPLLGMSDVVKRFLIDRTPGTHVTQMAIDDAEHYSPEERAAIIASYPAHEREARARGVPTMGSGRVFPVAEDYVRIDAFDIPGHWPQLCALDFGWDHPSAGIKMAWDRDNDVLYVIAAHRAREQTPLMFTTAVQSWGGWLPWAWPHDGLQHDKGSGEQLAAQYRRHGLKMLAERATFEDGTNGVEAGIAEMLDRMQTGRLKVFAHLNDWWEEFRLYHRENGLIVKKGDDLMSATRYGVMMRRFAQCRLRKAQPFVDETTGWMA